jgi:hypothetical protein
MPEAYREVASNLGCLYFDANTVTSWASIAASASVDLRGRRV